jgi:hypothetical protein
MTLCFFVKTFVLSVVKSNHKVHKEMTQRPTEDI